MLKRLLLFPRGTSYPLHTSENYKTYVSLSLRGPAGLLLLFHVCTRSLVPSAQRAQQPRKGGAALPIREAWRGCVARLTRIKHGASRHRGTARTKREARGAGAL
ncbi:hypothetical protein NDU88_000694 [Pleurodeles waltl]|uniref:Uncharacterized protein n=1 Tax=Pleurodeles waltl TaxID=8319 RepID=A0AAV7MIU3_PLEWA|nr:hypothetical protein NDU88_000694 [Pleurodeles waltl]